MLDLNDLYYFAAVVRHAGFASAGRALGIPKSNLSRRITRLEQQLGVRLLERTTRKLAVTDVGQEFYNHCQAMIAQAEAAEETTQRLRGEPHGLIRVACPNGLSAQLSTILPRFMQLYPQVRVQLVISNRRVDLIEERLDLALRARRRDDLDPNLVTKTLGQNRSVVVVAPALLAQYPAVRHPADLAQLPTVSPSEHTGRDSWLLYGPDEQTCTVEHEPRLSCMDFPMLIDAACAGIGVGLLPETMCAAQLESGRLVRVLPDWHTEDTLLHLVFTSRRGLLPAVRALVDYLSEQLPRVFADPTIRVTPELQ